MAVFYNSQSQPVLGDSEYKVTYTTNGDITATGQIYVASKALQAIAPGWKIRINGTSFVMIRTKPVDDGQTTSIEWAAIHEWLWKLRKSQANGLEFSYAEVPPEGWTAKEYLSKAFASWYLFPWSIPEGGEKRYIANFGKTTRLSLINMVMQEFSLEYRLNSTNNTMEFSFIPIGKDFSQVVRKGCNLNEITIETTGSELVTCLRGVGSAGENQPITAEYKDTALIAKFGGELWGATIEDSTLSTVADIQARLKSEISKSYSISVNLKIMDLIKEGYTYSKASIGDYVQAINETLGINLKVRLIEITESYTVDGKLYDLETKAGDLNMVDKWRAKQRQAVNNAAKVDNKLQDFGNQLGDFKNQLDDLQNPEIIKQRRARHTQDNFAIAAKDSVDGTTIVSAYSGNQLEFFYQPTTVQNTGDDNMYMAGSAAFNRYGFNGKTDRTGDKLPARFLIQSLDALDTPLANNHASGLIVPRHWGGNADLRTRIMLPYRKEENATNERGGTASRPEIEITTSLMGPTQLAGKTQVTGDEGNEWINFNGARNTSDSAAHRWNDEARQTALRKHPTLLVPNILTSAIVSSEIDYRGDLFGDGQSGDLYDREKSSVPNATWQDSQSGASYWRRSGKDGFSEWSALYFRQVYMHPTMEVDLHHGQIHGANPPGDYIGFSTQRPWTKMIDPGDEKATGVDKAPGWAHEGVNVYFSARQSAPARRAPIPEGRSYGGRALIIEWFNPFCENYERYDFFAVVDTLGKFIYDITGALPAIIPTSSPLYRRIVLNEPY